MPLDQLKEKIMHEFEKVHCKENEFVLESTFQLALFPQLNPKEQDMFSRAIQELIEDNNIVFDSNGSLLCYKLTTKGFNSLYKKSKSKEQLKEEVLDLFRKGNYRVGQAIRAQYIDLEWKPKLNPIEVKNLDEAINELIAKNFISFNKEAYALVLLQEGFDYIY